MVCIFEKTHARVVDSERNTVARFYRDGGLYTCTMKLRRPEARMNGILSGRSDSLLDVRKPVDSTG